MSAESIFSRVSSIAALVRDVGVILGIPVVLTVGVKLYDLQTKALEAQMKAVQAQNEVLKQTQYDRALTLMKSQKELFDNERASLERKIADLSASGTDKAAEIAKLKEKIVEVDQSEDELRRALASLGDSLKSVGGSTSPSSEMMMIEMMKLMGKEKALRAPPPADSKQTSPSEGQSRK
jgi:hypothetical protein